MAKVILVLSMVMLPAAMRYTEIRMSKFAHALLADLEKETVDFVPNYDETEIATRRYCPHEFPIY